MATDSSTTAREDARRFNALHPRTRRQVSESRSFPGWVKVASGRWFRVDSYAFTVSERDYVEYSESATHGEYMGQPFWLPTPLLTHIMKGDRTLQVRTPEPWRYVHPGDSDG